jgi:hypothetical protein
MPEFGARVGRRAQHDAIRVAGGGIRSTQITQDVGACAAVMEKKTAEFKAGGGKIYVPA